MFKLFRYFSLASAIVTILVTLALWALHREHLTRSIVVMAEQQNLAQVQRLADAPLPLFAAQPGLTAEPPAEGQRRPVEIQQIHDGVRAILANSPVVKVNIYDLDGVAIYSSALDEIGLDVTKDQAAFDDARRGQPSSALLEIGPSRSPDGEVTDRYIVQSYVQAGGTGGRPAVIFEIYADVTPRLHQIGHFNLEFALSVILALLALYLALALIVRRAERVLRQQHAALGETRDLMEAQVAARTVDLKSEMHEHMAARSTIETQAEELVTLADQLWLARQQTEKANRSKSEFLAFMSHELRTPLNAVLGFSEIIKDEQAGPIGDLKYREYAGDINEAGQHLLALVNDILDISKVESGVDELEEEAVDVGDLVRSAQTLVKERARKSEVAIEFERPDDLPPVRADPRKLKQILVNLLTNAIKFTDPGGKVTLKAWPQPTSGYVFQVIDTGIGIALADIPKVLSPFRQVSAHRDRNQEGTGLGLPLCKALAEQHGGSLDLQSKPAVGTTVTLRLPAERIEHGTAAPTAAASNR